ncbi:MAG: ABC transporter substrate-binding protein [Clostridiales bacterium]|jgi:spermidine/putrescine transport system substrate-binding protein|nr:ABC transporter substrate-binding protein [Clostridiales bacterium]
MSVKRFFARVTAAVFALALILCAGLNPAAAAFAAEAGAETELEASVDTGVETEVSADTGVETDAEADAETDTEADAEIDADASGGEGEGEEAGELELVCSEEYYRRFAEEGLSINVYNWGEYISDGSDGTLDINRAFTEATGVRVNYSTYATNEELYSKLRSGNANYDVIIPSDYMIGRMAAEGMLAELDFSNIPNARFLDPKFQSLLFDPENRYSAPYTWGYVGIIYNRSMIFDEEEVGSWDILWDEKYLGNILMFSNSRDAFAIAQARLGYSMNTTDERELRECLEQLKQQKPLVQAYVMDEIFDKMLGGEAALAPYYAGDALTMISENDGLGFAIPAEGTNLFVDAMCIPKASRQKAAAELYINFMLEPEVGAANSEYIGYATPNAAALELFDEEAQTDPIAYPAAERLLRTESFAALPQDTSRLMDQLWTELLSSDETYNRLLVPMILLAAVLLSAGLNIWRAYYRRNARRNY